MVKTAFLRQVPVLADLPEELLEQLAAETGELEVPAGDWLLREGDAAESLYVVRSGRLEVLAEGPPEVLIRVLRRGDVLGELALLQEGVRSASVRARRDSDLLELSRDQFERLIADAPSFAVGLTRSMGAQLAESRTPMFAATPPGTIAVVALDDEAPGRDAAELLTVALREHGSVAVLNSDPTRPPAEWVSALDRAEAEVDRVVLLGDATSPGDEWTDFCVREADLVLALSGRTPRPAWLQRPDALRGCELMICGGPAKPGAIAALAPREVQSFRREELKPRIEASARRLAGRSIGVVLSGGGARAFAHLGVIEELLEAGVVIDRIGGVSLGSVVGSGIALGRDPDDVLDRFRNAFLESNPTGDYTLPLFSLIRGQRTRQLLRDFVGDVRIEELPRRFFCVSCDLIERESVLHRSGPLADAVCASLSIPGLFPPISTEDGRLLVDGGVLDNLPVAAMARAGEGPVIAADVTGTIGGFKQPTRPGIARLSRPVRRYLTGAEAELPRLAETVVRTVTVGSIDTADAARRHADLVIQPQVDGIGLLDWRQLDRVREAGREAARTAMEDAPQWLSA